MTGEHGPSDWFAVLSFLLSLGAIALSTGGIVLDRPQYGLAGAAIAGVGVIVASAYVYQHVQVAQA